MPATVGAKCAARARSHARERGENPSPAAKLPNLFVVGAAKAGTTAVHHYFKAHPDVVVPQRVKETNYMAFYTGLPPLEGPNDQHVARNSITRLEDYVAAFAHWTAERIGADVSPAYLYFPQAAYRIAELCSDAKIVMLLRNPVDCAFSMYSMMRRDKREPCRSFRSAFERTDERILAGWQWFWDLKGGWLYSQQIAPYLELFAPQQLFIRRYDDLQREPETFYRELTGFLGIELLDPSAANRRVNTAPSRHEMFAKRRLGRLILRSAHVAARVMPASLQTRFRHRLMDRPAFVLSDVDRHLLVDHYADDIRRLGKMLDWDLSDWLAI